jgi:hypothetical protein
LERLFEHEIPLDGSLVGDDDDELFVAVIVAKPLTADGGRESRMMMPTIIISRPVELIVPTI